MAPALLLRTSIGKGHEIPGPFGEAARGPRDPGRLAPCALRSEIRTPSPRFRTGKGWAIQEVVPQESRLKVADNSGGRNSVQMVPALPVRMDNARIGGNFSSHRGFAAGKVEAS